MTWSDRFTAWLRSDDDFPGWFSEKDGEPESNGTRALLWFLIFDCFLIVGLLWWWGYI